MVSIIGVNVLDFNHWNQVRSTLSQINSFCDKSHSPNPTNLIGFIYSSNLETIHLTFKMTLVGVQLWFLCFYLSKMSLAKKKGWNKLKARKAGVFQGANQPQGCVFLCVSHVSWQTQIFKLFQKARKAQFTVLDIKLWKFSYEFLEERQDITLMNNTGNNNEIADATMELPFPSMTYIT